MSVTESKAIHGAVGRRKTASARVRLFEGTGKIVVNNLELARYFKTEAFRKVVTGPLAKAELSDKLDVVAIVAGGGSSAQATAVAHGIARALLKLKAEFRPALKKAGMLTRDPREKERKKAGRPGARKRFQFSKR